MLELFVPGRVCLLGEHSDWAGGFRKFNKNICPGFTIVTGVNQGLYARVEKHPSKLILTSTDNDGCQQTAEISMDPETLLKVAREGGHWSYVAGVAYKILETNLVGGLVINNYRTNLPLKKGLSSSAAICVLTARAFNKLYDLRMTVRGEMEFAYQGEILTPSQCGRLDQACAFGSTPVLMTYDGEFTAVEKINVKMELHFVIVDLCAKKSTVEILKRLQEAYPFPQTDLHKALLECLGFKNKDITHRALKLLTGKDERNLSNEETLEELGKLLTEAQKVFDQYAGPVCPSQLTAPVLHKCLEYGPLQQYIVGGKGVGAGGDGTAQLLCKSAEAQTEVARIIKDELNMDPLLLTISPGSKIQTAVIPAGGFAGTLFPASQACKAELFPIYDPKDGLCKPLILTTVEQLLEAGLERVVLIVQQDDLVQFQRLFHTNVTPGNARKLPDEMHESYARHTIDLGRHVEFVVQEQQRGFGDAVYCAKDLVGNNPMLLVLGHHVYLSSDTNPKSCAEQILDAHKAFNTNVVGLKRTHESDVSKFGTVAGSFKEDDENTLTVTSVQEKPSIEFARQNLHVEGLPQDEYLTMFGMYALDPKIFDILEQSVQHDLRNSNGEIGLTPALDQLRQQAGLCGIIVDGERLPINSPESFIETNAQLLAKKQAKKQDN